MGRTAKKSNKQRTATLAKLDKLEQQKENENFNANNGVKEEKENSRNESGKIQIQRSISDSAIATSVAKSRKLPLANSQICSNNMVGIENCAPSSLESDTVRLEREKKLGLFIIGGTCKVQWNHTQIKKCSGQLLTLRGEKKIGIFTEMVFKCAECSRMEMMKNDPSASGIYSTGVYKFNFMDQPGVAVLDSLSRITPYTIDTN